MAGEAIRFNASLNTAGFDSGAKNLQNLAANASAGITRHFGKIATAVVGIGAAFIGVRAAVQAFSSAIAMGGELDDLTKRTGLAAGEILLLQKAFELGGSSADAVGGTIDRLRRSIVQAGNESSAQAESFSALGLSVSELKNLTPTEQLEKVASAIMRVGNDSQRSAIAMDIFGKSGGELVPLFSNFAGELEKARGYLGSTPQIMTRVSETFADLGDNFVAIGEKGKEFAAGLLEQIAPALVDVTTRLANIDAAGFGAKLSEYAASTLAWFTETFKLSTALSQIETAIKAITEGEFGEGLSLMFMTARNTALNAINEVVAMAMAAVQTVGEAMRSLFAPSSTTMAFIEGSFQMLGAKLASGIFDAVGSVLENIPFMGAAAQAVRSAQDEAEQAVTDISNIMHYEAENLKSEWGGIMAEMPKQFADSYAQNAANPLIDMNTRLAEAEALAAGIASNIAAAGSAAATVDPKVAGATETAGERIAREEAEARENSGKSGVGGSGGAGRGKGSSGAMTFNERVAEMQGNARAQRDEELAARYEAGGFMRSAVRAQDRAQRRRDEAMDRGRMKDHLSAMGFNNMGEAFAQYERDVPMQGRMNEAEFKQFQKQMIEQAKTPQERSVEEEAMREKHGGKGGQGTDFVSKIYDLIKTHIPSIDEKLPQTALVYS